MKDDAVVQRIRKFLALAASPNAHEAAIARRRADELLTSLGLKEEDIVRPLASKIGEHPLPEHHDFKMEWRFALLTVFAHRFGCKTLRIQDAYHWRGVVVGTKDAADVVIETFLEIDERLRKRALEDFQKHVFDKGYQPLRSWKMSYCLGAALAIQRRVLNHNEPIVVDFEERRRTDEDQLNGGVETTKVFTEHSTSHLREIVDEHVRAQYPQAGRFRAISTTMDGEADVEGYRIGFDAGMNLPFPGSDESKLALPDASLPATTAAKAEVVFHNEPPSRAKVDFFESKSAEISVDFFTPTMYRR